MSVVIKAARAWQNAARDEASRWSEISKRFASDPFHVGHQPKFSFGPEASVFCMGSCFARNVEEHLIYQGVDVLSKRVISPRSEWAQRPNGFLNKFTTHSMLQEIRWQDDPPADPSLYLVETAQGWRDLQLAPGLPAATLERAVERRAYLAREYFPRLRQADVLLLTLGLNEVWRDVTTNTRLNAAPPLWSVRKNPDRYEFEVTDASENLEALNEIRDRIRRYNANVRFVVTVSPVPLQLTFSGRDVSIANTRSKSTLRAAADAFQDAWEDVDYFPSYEIATLTSRPYAYAADQLHVRDELVRHIMQQFSSGYLGSARLDPDGFAEWPYLEANPDVDQLVRTGALGSGFEHWIATGRSEQRALRPLVASAVMTQAGL